MRKHLTLMWSYYKEDPKMYTRVIILTVIVGLLEFIGISSLMPAISLIVGGTAQGVPSALVRLMPPFSPNVLVLIYVLLVVVQTVISIINENTFLKSIVRWGVDLSMKYLRNITDADFEYSKNIKPGEIETVITRNVGFALRIRHNTARFMSGTILSLFYVLIASVIDYHILVLFLIIALVVLILNRCTLGVRLRHSVIAKEKQFVVARYISEYFSDMRGLLVHQRDRFFYMVEESLTSAYRSLTKNSQTSIFMRLLHQPIIFLTIISSLWIFRFIFHLSNAKILIILFVFYRAGPQLMQAIQEYGAVIEESPSDVAPDIKKWAFHKKENRNSAMLSPTEFSVVFEGVSVSHGKSTIISDAHITIPDKSYVAFIGKSGVGKSTLLDVICGWKKIDSGRVIIGGVDASQINYDPWLRECVSLVRQESVIVSGNIAENIAYLVDTADHDRIAHLAQITGVDTFLSMRDGIYTSVEARGENLSAGQRQRILLARALYKNPKILLLDEPTSNLDAKTESDIVQLLVSLKGKLTIILTSHRGSLLRNADQIYEIGNHAISRVSP